MLISNTPEINTARDYMPICIAQGVGFGFAMSANRRGHLNNRFLAMIAFGFNGLVILAFQLHVWAPGR